MVGVDEVDEWSVPQFLPRIRSCGLAHEDEHADGEITYPNSVRSDRGSSGRALGGDRISKRTVNGE